ncbi:MAG TPA: hypothetical protein VM509_09580 [Planctomycetota bacterium]|nr:hypothetical protein [Planctomycetota bacterium]
MEFHRGRPEVDFAITFPQPWSWLAWVFGGSTFLFALRFLSRWFARRFAVAAESPLKSR